MRRLFWKQHSGHDCFNYWHEKVSSHPICKHPTKTPPPCKVLEDLIFEVREQDQNRLVRYVVFIRVSYYHLSEIWLLVATFNKYTTKLSCQNNLWYGDEGGRFFFVCHLNGTILGYLYQQFFPNKTMSFKDNGETHFIKSMWTSHGLSGSVACPTFILT